MVKRKKLMGTYIFFTAVWNGVQITCDNLYSKVVTGNIVSKWWPITEWNKSYFFPLVNFGSSWTARMTLLLSGLDMTLIVTSRDLNWNVFKMAVD